MTEDQWKEIDRHLSRSEVFAAGLLYISINGCGIAEAKSVIGNRFREQYPELWSGYRDLGEDD